MSFIKHLRRSAWAAAMAVAAGTAGAAVLVLQPGDGKDAQITSAFNQGDVNFGGHPELIINWADNGRSVGLIEFDLGALPAGAVVTSATLSLFHTLNNSNGTRYDLFRITSPWDEGTVTMNTAPSFDGAAASSLLIGNTQSGLYRDWDVTALVAGWSAGSFANHGMWIEEVPIAGGGVAYFASSDMGGSDLDPILTITYRDAQAPLPGTLALLGAGLLGLGAIRRRA